MPLSCHAVDRIAADHIATSRLKRGCKGRDTRSMSRDAVIVADNNYVAHGAVALFSLAENNPDESIRAFVVLTEDVSADSRRHLAKLSRLPNLDVQIIDRFRIDNDKYGFRLFGHYTIATFYRLFFQHILPDDVSQILYLDCDTIVNKSLTELFNINLGSHFFAAVEDFCLTPDHYCKDLLMPAGAPYCNAGVMLINMNKWREENALDLFVDTNQRLMNQPVWVDQDLINATLFDRWLPLSPAYNFQTNGFESYRHAYFRKHNKEYPTGYLTFSLRERDEAAERPHVIHYTVHRPWEPDNAHPFRETYWSYRKRIPIRKSWGENRLVHSAKRLLLAPLRAIKRAVPQPIRPFLKKAFGKS